MIEKYGDPLEQQFSSFIQEKLSNYELIWKKYIGNDGTGHIYPLPSLDTESQGEREKFSQHHYTILESCICLKIINDKPPIEINDSVLDNLEIVNDLISFHAHIGRIRDNVGDSYKEQGLLKYAYIVKTEWDDYLNRIKGFWKKRCTVLHGIKLPFSVKHHSFYVPEPRGEVLKQGVWASKMTWQDISSSDLIRVNEYFKDSFIEFIPIINEILGEIYHNHLRSIIAEKEIKIIFPPLEDGTITTRASGSVDE